jgi:predicted acyltransferase
MPTATATLPQRVSSVDTYRGLVMFLMMAEVLEFGHVAEAFPDSSFWAFMHHHQSHVPWWGCSLHDLIQPSFTFLVGVALPYSMASRTARAQSTSSMWLHTLRRALILILLGIFLRSMYRPQTNFTFEDTLTQIGLGYPFLFALGFRSERTAWLALAGVLVGYWLLFAFYPLPGAGFDWTQTGVAADWEHQFSGFAAHWNKNTNAAWAFDRWFLNLFPREKPFLYNGGGYATLSFIPTLGTMILGLIAGRWLKASPSSTWLLRRFLLAAAGLFAVSLLIHFLGAGPIVKRIWTPTWTLFSGAWCFVLLAAFSYIVDVKKNQNIFFFLIVIGMNSIAAYVLAHTVVGFIDSSFRTNLSQTYDLLFGEPYKTLVSGMVILAVQWGILYWMYIKKIFIRI